MPYKILQVGKYFSSKGGIETITRSLVSTLQNNHQIDVLCFSNSCKTNKLKVGSSSITEAGTFFKFLSSPISIKFFKHFKSLRKKYDILIIHTPNPLAALASILFPTDAKIIVQWHGDILNKRLFYFLFKPLEKIMLKRADLILATSSIYIEHSSVLQNFKNKCKVLPLGINENNLTSDPEIVEKIKQKYQYKKIVFALGRYVYYKGFEYLIEAAKYLNDEIVILIGGYGSLQKFYEQRINELHLQNTVFLVAELNENAWGNYFEACDIFCLPSYEKAESFGLVLLEAMSFSKPIVATNIPGSGTPVVNAHTYSGLNVSIKNSKEIAAAIQSILYSEDYEAYCKNSRKRFDENFTEQKMIDQLLVYINEMYRPNAYTSAELYKLNY
jgi:glycosyltransferase involved in cell wall biosynthesis